MAEQTEIMRRVSRSKARMRKVLLVLLLQVRLLMYWVIGDVGEGIGEVGTLETVHRGRHLCSFIVTVFGLRRRGGVRSFAVFGCDSDLSVIVSVYCMYSALEIGRGGL